jgi:hypothetical protein
VKKYYSLYSVQNVEAQRCTHVFIISLYTAKGKMKRLYFEPSSAEERKEWMKAIQYVPCTRWFGCAPDR